MNKRFGLGLAMVGMIVVGAATTQTLSAQQQAIKRTVLQKTDLTGITSREGVMIQGEIPPGAESGRHVHPGTELGYLLEGALVLEVEGSAPMTLNAGSSWTVDASKVHNARNIGDSLAKTLVVYVVEKGKPLASPAP